MMNSTRPRSAVVAMALMLATFAPSVIADMAAVGPIDPVSGFPIWFQDSNGVALELLPFQNPATGALEPYSISAPPDPNNAYSLAMGFGDEAFWWSAEAQLDLPFSGRRARLVLAQEAAFMGDGSAVFGNNFAFGRLRIRIDDAVNGVYTVTHPYGVNVFTVDTAVDDRIFYTHDNGDLYPYLNNRILGSAIGPFLVSLDPDVPTGYVGDPAAAAPVAGSPTGNNIFRVQGPNGLDVQTSLFSVSGRLYAGTTLEVDGADLALEDGFLRAAVVGNPNTTNTLTVTGGVLAVDQINGNLDQLGGTLAAGNSPGKTDISGNYLLGPGGVLEVEIEGLAGKGEVGGHDFYRVRGDTTLQGWLSVVLLAPLEADDVGAVFEFLRYDKDLTGHFAGLEQGQTFLVPTDFGSPYAFRIDYGQGDKDSITLTLTAVPEPATVVLVMAGALATALRMRRRRA